MAVHLVQRGFVVRLVTAAGEEQGGAWHEHGAADAETAPLLESLAVVTEVAHPHLDVRWLSDPGHSGLMVAVLGAVGEHDKPALTRMRHAAASAMAVALDVNAWTRSGAAVELEPAAWLASRGWRAVSAGPADPLSAVWQELGRTGRAKHTGRDRLSSLQGAGGPVPAAPPAEAGEPGA